MRPASIVQFERLYLGALAISVIADAMNWSAAQAAIQRNPQIAAAGPIVLIAGLAISYVAMIALWYLAARRQSAVAKWILAIWFVLSTVFTALALFRGGFSLSVAAVLGWAAYLLRAWGVSYLFKPDADAWFAKSK